MKKEVRQCDKSQKKAVNHRGPRAKNGSDCVYKPKGMKRWRAQRPFGRKPDGKVRFIVAYGRTQIEARENLRQKIEDEKKKNPQLDSDFFVRLTLSELCYFHLNVHLSEEDRLKPKSADRRESTIRNQIEKYPIGKLQASSITSFDIDNHIEGLIKPNILSISSIEKAYNVINSAYNWAISQQMLNYNPCIAVHDKLIHRFTSIEAKRSTTEKIRVLSLQEISAFKQESNKLCKNGKRKYRIGLPAQLLLATAERVGELCANKWSDWDRNTHTLSITQTRCTAKDRDAKPNETIYKTREGPVKNCHWREIQLSPEAEEILTKIYLTSKKHEPDDYIVLNRNNKPTCPTRFITSLNNLFINAGLSDEVKIHRSDVSGAHIFRRTCATMMADAGIPTIKIAAYLGDLESTIIKHYIATSKKIKVGNITKNIVPYPTI